MVLLRIKFVMFMRYTYSTVDATSIYATSEICIWVGLSHGAASVRGGPRQVRGRAFKPERSRQLIKLDLLVMP